MAITVEDAQSNVAANGGNVTVNFTALENDVVVVVATNSTAAAAISMSTSGYTEIEAPFAGTSYNGGAWRKTMGGTPDSAVTVNNAAGAQDSMGVIVYVLRGVDTGTPEDATRTLSAESSDGNPFDGPAITTVTDGALVITAGWESNDNLGSGIAAPSGYSNLLTAYGSDTRRCTTAGAVKLVASAGEENPGAFTDTYVTENRKEITMAFRPAGAGGGGGTSPNALRMNSAKGNLGVNMTTR